MRARVLNKYLVMCRHERVVVELVPEGDREEVARVAVYVGVKKLGERDVTLLPGRRERLEFPYRPPFSTWLTAAWVRVLADGKPIGDAQVPVLPFELWVPFAAVGSLVALHFLQPLGEAVQRASPQHAPLVAQLLQLLSMLSTLSLMFAMVSFIGCSMPAWPRGREGERKEERGERRQETAEQKQR